MQHSTGIILFILNIKFQLLLCQVKSQFVPVSFLIANPCYFVSRKNYFMSHKKYRVYCTSQILKNQVFMIAFPLFCTKSFVSIFLSEHINFQGEWNVNWCYAQAGLSFLKFKKKKKKIKTNPTGFPVFIYGFQCPVEGGLK